MKAVIYVLGISMLLFSACKDNDCPEGYECVEDVCMCPDDKFEIKGLNICKELEAGEYFGISDCLFTDTLLVKFESKDPSNNLYHGELYTSYDGGLNSTFVHTYTEGNDFDSLLSIFVFDPTRETVAGSFIGPARFHDDGLVGADLSGRLTEDGFEGNIEWRLVRTFHGNRIGELVESCPISLVTQ